MVKVSMTSAAVIVLVVCIVLTASVLAARSRHKKAGTDHIRLVGSTGLVDTKLAPQGTVLIQGELWHACSNDGIELEPGCKVEVVGSRDHLLLVRLKND
jgi:membrane-bound ClpP family serine protease